MSLTAHHIALTSNNIMINSSLSMIVQQQGVENMREGSCPQIEKPSTLNHIIRNDPF